MFEKEVTIMFAICLLWLLVEKMRTREFREVRKVVSHLFMNVNFRFEQNPHLIDSRCMICAEGIQIQLIWMNKTAKYEGGQLDF